MSELNGRMYFEYQFNDQSPKVTISLSPESSLPEVVESFESFLRACGYSFDGSLDFIEEEVHERSDN